MAQGFVCCRMRNLVALPENEDGPTELCGPPVTQLLPDIALRPKLLGQLVPWQYNIWMGNNKDVSCFLSDLTAQSHHMTRSNVPISQGSSSGLHHDYHDNLYVLLRGRKRFTLFPPTAEPQLYTNGQIALV